MVGAVPLLHLYAFRHGKSNPVTILEWPRGFQEVETNFSFAQKGRYDV